MRQRASVALVIACAACGDNLASELPLEPARVLFIAAHMDDDLIFMQTDLADSVARGGTATVYLTSRDPRGEDASHRRYAAIRTAYGKVAGDEDWLCGKVVLDGLRARHCRLYGHDVSQLALNVPDGGRRAELGIGIVQLVQGDLPAVELAGDRSATRDDLIGELAEVIAATAPQELHILDYAAELGDDHPDHTMVGSFSLWAIARAGYHGLVVSHRGYGVYDFAVNLVGDDYARAHQMVGYYEACNDGCAPCGQACTTINQSHDDWVQRQYATTIAFSTGKLSPRDLPGRCLAVIDGVVQLADCADPGAAHLDEQGQLVVGAACLASPLASDAPLVVTPCDRAPASRWYLDGNGGLWNGRPVEPTGEDMRFDHTRCLMAAPLAAPVCGSRQLGRWQLAP